MSDEIIVVAVSGGADSTALLLGLDELIKAEKLSVILFVAHLDHGLRDSSRKDAKWVSGLAKDLGHNAVTGHTKIREIAHAQGDNLEQAARQARYDFFARTAKRKGSRFVLTAHTMDDQAETVMLRLMRGSASIGLGGMDAIRHLEGTEKVKLVRPLLWARRTDTEEYCKTRRIKFLHDEMNDDETFARVKVRKQLLPLMESFNKRVVEALSRTAKLLKEDSTLLLSNADDLLTSAIVELEDSDGRHPKNKSPAPSLKVDILLNSSPALRRRALRQWISEAKGDARRLEMVHLLAVERLLEGNRSGRRVELPGGSSVVRKGRLLVFEAEND